MGYRVGADPLRCAIACDALRGLNSPRATRAARVLLTLFALNGILLQALVAHALGIREVDELSFLGAYFLGNGLLFGATLLSLRADYLQVPDSKR